MNDSFWFALIAAALVAVVLALLVMPALRRGGSAKTPPPDEARQALAAQKADLDARLARGELAQDAYEEQMRDLERRALAELRGKRAAPLAESRRMRIATAAVLLAAVPLCAWVFYRLWGDSAILEMDTPRAAAPTASQQAAVSAASDPAGELAAQASLRARDSISDQTSDRDLESWARQHPEDGRAAVMYARRLADRGQFGQATEFYLGALASDPKAKNAAVLTEAAAAMLSIDEKASLPGRLRKAARMLDDALALQPAYGPALKVRSAVAVEQGEWAVAERALRAMAAKFPAGSPERAQLEKDAERARGLARGKK